jgi:hypothetical protein
LRPSVMIATAFGTGVAQLTYTFDQEAFAATGAVAASHLLGLIERKRHHPGGDLLSGLTRCTTRTAIGSAKPNC